LGDREMDERISSFEELEKLVRDGESQVLEFKPENEVEVKGNDNRILRGVVALANARGGNLVIGVIKEGNAHKITGTKYAQDYVLNWISSLVKSFVDPPDLRFSVYPVESRDGLRCICIYMPRSGTKYALRYFGRESKKAPSYFLLLRLGDSSGEVDFSTFFSIALNNLLEGLSSLPSQIRTSEIPTFQEPGTKFDLEGLGWYLNELKKSLEPSVKQKLVDEFQNRLTDLPRNYSTAWTTEIKTFASSLLDFIKSHVEDEQFRDKMFLFLDVISDRCDEDTLNKTRELFLSKLDDLYENPGIKKNSHLLSLMQGLRNYDPKFMKKLLMDALDNWNKDEFDRLYTNIELHRLADKKEVMKLRSDLIDIVSESKKMSNQERSERATKFYELIRFI
jgi:hypothetical protein